PKHENDPGNDLQTLDIVDPSTDERITRLWAQVSTGDNWRFLQFDLTALRGRTVRVQFAVNNDGSGGRTALYLDNVSLLACDVAPAPTPHGTTITPIVSPTPTTTGFPTTVNPTL